MLKNRAPDFTRVKYEFAYPDPQAAAAGLAKVADKRRVTISPTGEQVVSPGRQLGTREEKLSENTLTFLAQIKTSRIRADDPLIKGAEEDLSAGGGVMTKAIL
jgi:hypothetical protein